VHESCAGDLFFDPATAEELYEPARYYYLAHSAGHRAQVGPFVSV